MSRKYPERIPNEYKKSGMKSGDILLGKIIECIEGERCKLVETWSRADEEGGEIKRREFSKVDIKELGGNDEANIEYMRGQSRLWGIPSSVDIMDGGGRVFISKYGDIESMMVYRDRGHLCKTNIKIRRKNHVICIPDTEMDKHSKSSKDTLNYIVSHPITKAVIRSMFEIYNVPEDVYVVMLKSNCKCDYLSPPGGYYAANEMTVNITLNSVLLLPLNSKTPNSLNVGTIAEIIIHECVHLAESQSGLTYSGHWRYSGGRPIGVGSELIATTISKDIVKYLFRYDWQNIRDVILSIFEEKMRVFLGNYYSIIQEITDALLQKRLIWNVTGIYIDDQTTGSIGTEKIAVSFAYMKDKKEEILYFIERLREEGYIIDYVLTELEEGLIDEDLGKLICWIDISKDDYNRMLKGVYFDDYL